MKKYKVMMVAVLGVIALVLGFLLMPEVTISPKGLAEEGAGGGMPIGTEVVLSNNTVATYLGKTSDGKCKWQATFEGPKYLDDLQTPIDARWEWDTEKGEWNACDNLFTATAKGSKITVWYNSTKLSWQPDVFIGTKKQAVSTEQLLATDPMNENYHGNTLQWHYGDIVRNVRIIEGMLIEYYTIDSIPADDVMIISHSDKDAGFVWTRPATAWDNNTKPINLTVDGDDLTLTLETMQSATFPITIDPGASFSTSSSDGHLRMRSAAFETKSEAWDSAHDSTIGYVFTSEIYTETWVELYTTDNGYKADIARGIVYFDTSGLPDDATIYDATLRLYGTYLESGYGDWGIIIQSGMPIFPHDPAKPEDYSYTHYSGILNNGGAISSGDMGYGYKNIPLNERGIDWIDKTGTTKFCLREWPHDTKNVCPTDVDKINRWQWYSYEQGQGYWPELIVYYETPPLLEKYAPVLYFHPNEDYYTDSIDSMLNESNLTLYKSEDDREFILKNPTTDNLASHNTSEYYTDMRNAEPGSILTATPPDPNRFTGYPHTVYGRQVEVDNYIVLQYWFFYPYNKWWNCHEGDWERIQIVCDKATETPINVTFGQHRGGETVTWDPADISLVEGTHPKVFVGIGSHSSWPTDGLHVLDLTSDDGIVSFPNYVSSSEDSYTLTDMSSGHSWVKWQGTWGCFVPGPLGGYGKCGPDSPANVVIVYNYTTGEAVNIWDDPIGWAKHPGSPWIIGQASCPVRLHAYDSSGNHTGLNQTGWIETEIPGTYFYVPASNQSDAELMWIYTEENLAFTLEATGVGEFNFSLAKSQSDEVTADYSHVEVTENTTAKVDTSQTPIAVMQIDFDGDGRFDRSKFPDGAGNSTLVGKVSFLGRGDPPNDRWIETFVVRFFEPSTYNELSWSPLYSTTNSSGYFTITGLPAGTYDIGIKGRTSLSEMVTNVTLHSTVAANFDTTREGDADGNDVIFTNDKVLLFDAWGSEEGGPNWSPNVDFDRSGNIFTPDKVQLNSNWGKYGDLFEE